MIRATPRPVAALYFHRMSGAGGGAERMILALAEGLAERGWLPHLLSWDDPGAECFYEVPDCVVWHRLGGGTGVTGKIRRAFTMARRLGSIQARVLVGFVMSGDRTVLTAAKVSGTRLIAAERNSPSIYRLRYGPLRRAAAFATLGQADAVTVQFPRFVSDYPASLRRLMHTIPNPVPSAVLSANPAQPDKHGRFRLLFVGRLDPLQKRPSLLFDAFARVAQRHPDWDLVFVGDGPDAGTLRARIATAGLVERVQIIPSTPSVERVYATAHLFAITSVWEGFPNALAEAMAAGLPAVGFAGCDGVVDLIEKAGGWLVPGRQNAEAFADALDEAMAMDGLRATRGHAARVAAQEYRPEQIFDCWSELLYSVCEVKR